jgi:hypothetical protein
MPARDLSVRPSDAATTRRAATAARVFATVRMAVAVDDESVGKLADVVAACRRNGLDVEATLTSIGVVVGVAHPDAMVRLRSLPGVAAVETEHALARH